MTSPIEHKNAAGQQLLLLKWGGQKGDSTGEGGSHPLGTVAKEHTNTSPAVSESNTQAFVKCK